VDRDGRLFNQRLSQEWQEALKRSKDGKKAISARWKKDNGSNTTVSRSNYDSGTTNTNTHTSGPPGTGKTTMMGEIYRLAGIARPMNNSRVWTSMMRYQSNTIAVATGGTISGSFMRPSSIMRNNQFFTGFFIDDFDKCSGSEFIRLNLHDLIDTIYDTESQLVLSTNMNKIEFAQFFGDAIDWRIKKHCTWVEMARAA
jgi:hypothetical protein